MSYPNVCNEKFIKAYQASTNVEQPIQIVQYKSELSRISL